MVPVRQLREPLLSPDPDEEEWLLTRGFGEKQNDSRHRAADGALSFFFESLGCKVESWDYVPTNMNRMAGLYDLAQILGSGITIQNVARELHASERILYNDLVAELAGSRLLRGW
jgi:hypothetical protein